MTRWRFAPRLTCVEAGGVVFWTDTVLADVARIRVCFTERQGGVSEPPYSSLNLAAHVDDSPARVDENRRRLLSALGTPELTARLTCAQQVHGDGVFVVSADAVGCGARATSGPAPVPNCDALVTCVPEAPLLMCFADCVPIVLACPGGVAVVHAGWRGALARIPARAVESLTAACGCAPSNVFGYLGPHIGACHYEVGDKIMSHFVKAFGTVARADSRHLDLGTVVNASLNDAGVDSCSIARLGVCTAETTERFFSHRAEGGLTGRHGGLACVLSG